MPQIEQPKRNAHISRDILFSRLNQKEIGNLNRSITSNETELAIKKKLSVNKSPGPDGFTGGFYHSVQFSSVQSLSHVRLFATP